MVIWYSLKKTYLQSPNKTPLRAEFFHPPQKEKCKTKTIYTNYYICVILRFLSLTTMTRIYKYIYVLYKYICLKNPIICHWLLFLSKDLSVILWFWINLMYRKLGIWWKEIFNRCLRQWKDNHHITCTIGTSDHRGSWLIYMYEFPENHQQWNLDKMFNLW